MKNEMERKKKSVSITRNRFLYFEFVSLKMVLKAIKTDYFWGFFLSRLMVSEIDLTLNGFNNSSFGYLARL
jgi:hypothetical protein